MRRFFLRILLFAVSALAGFSPAAPTRPNIIFIVADDMGNADTGFQGAKDIPTPHLDALARSGVRCTNGYVSHPFCSPTRAGLMTGRYQQRFGHENNPVFDTNDTASGLPLSETMLPALLRDAGYATGWVGKWHLGAADCFHPMNRGYTDAFGFLGGGHQYFAKDLNKPEVEYFTPLQRNREPVTETGYLTDIFGREAVAFIQRHAKEPFFLYLAFNCPHSPLQAPDAYLERVGAAVTDPKRRIYAAMVIAQDDAIGKVMEALGALKLEESTLVCFISDNGGPVGERSNGSSNGALRAGKGTVYEGGIRVPFVLRWKGTLPGGRDYPQPVISLDLARTALAVAGGKEAEGRPMDGVNLIPFLKGGNSAAPHESLFWRHGGGASFAVRNGSMKLVLHEGQKPELYDLAADIGEQDDLAARRPESVAKLEALRATWNAGLDQARVRRTVRRARRKNHRPRPEPINSNHHLMNHLLVFLGVAITATSGLAASKPNIIFILCDDLGYGDVKCLNPEGKIATPHMDSIAAQGMKFTDAHSSSAVCTPTRYGVMTGRYNWRSKLQSGVLGGLSPRLIEPDRLTVASFLKQQGYATACVGKWHLGMDWVKRGGKEVSELSIETPDQVDNVDYGKPIANGPTSVGFDSYFGISASLDMVPYCFIENDRVTALPTEKLKLAMNKGGPVSYTREGPGAPGFKGEDVLPTLTKHAVALIRRRPRRPNPARRSFSTCRSTRRTRRFFPRRSGREAAASASMPTS